MGSSHPSSDQFEKVFQYQQEGLSITPPFYKKVELESIDTLNEMLALNLRKMGYVRLLPIQTYAISMLLSGKNLVVCAPTGSGKTGAFLIPAIELVDRYRRRNGWTSRPLVLILGNTQNLMNQTFRFACEMAGYVPNVKGDYNVRIFDLFGGTRNFRLNNIKTIEHEIVVATCGGVIKAMMCNKIDLSDLKLLIIDEACEMLNEYRGFAYDVYQIMSRVPRDTTIAEFSATFCEENKQIVLSNVEKKLFGDNIPVFINIPTPRGYIIQRVVEKGERIGDNVSWKPTFGKDLAMLVRLIESDLILHQMKKGGPYKKSTVVFVDRKITSNYLTIFLRLLGYDFEPFNSDYPLTDILMTIDAMQSGRIQGVVATNKLARGQDIPEVDHVIIYEMSRHFDDYKHRIGRTSRMGRGGRATIMLSPYNDSELIIPLVEFLQYHSQTLPSWLWDLYLKMKGRSDHKEVASFSDSFMTAATEICDSEQNNDNDLLMDTNDNNLSVDTRRSSDDNDLFVDTRSKSSSDCESFVKNRRNSLPLLRHCEPVTNIWTA